MIVLYPCVLYCTVLYCPVLSLRVQVVCELLGRAL